MTTINDLQMLMAVQGQSEELIGIGFSQHPYYRRIVALGNKAAVTTGGVPTDIWPVTGNLNFPATAAATELLSSSANDSAAGTGARTIRVLGLDTNYNEIQEDAILSGTTPVALSNQYIRINTVFTLTSGSGGINAGDITVRQVTGSVIMSVAPALYGQSRSSLYTVPAGFTLQVISILGSINRATAAGVQYATIATAFRTQAGNVRLPLEFGVSSTLPYRHDATPGIIVAEKNDFFIRCQDVSTNNTNLTAAWLGVLKKNVLP